MSTCGIKRTWPSWSSSMLCSTTRSSFPLKRRCRSIGVRVRTSTSRPENRSKSLSLTRGRARPGELTSRRYPPEGSKSSWTSNEVDTSRLTPVQSSSDTPLPTSMPGTTLSMTTRMTIPAGSLKQRTSTNSTPWARQIGSINGSSALTSCSVAWVNFCSGSLNEKRAGRGGPPRRGKPNFQAATYHSAPAPASKLTPWRFASLTARKPFWYAPSVALPLGRGSRRKA